MLILTCALRHARVCALLVGREEVAGVAAHAAAVVREADALARGRVEEVARRGPDPGQWARGLVRRGRGRPAGTRRD